MGRKSRMKPARLSEKLLQIRTSLGLSQAELLRRLGFEDLIDYRRISEFELGEAEPPLPVLLQYARATRVNVEDIIDDELDLPSKLPSNVRYQGLKRKPTSPKRKQ
jgi:transcriptional regulator with XRE-family HTH domain